MEKIRSFLTTVSYSLLACGAFLFSLVFGFDWLTFQVDEVMKEMAEQTPKKNKLVLYESEQIPLEIR